MKTPPTINAPAAANSTGGGDYAIVTGRTTFEEHIRKAESKVVHAMTPFMMMYAKVPGSPFVNSTRAAGAPTGLRIMKQIIASTQARPKAN